MKLSLCLIALSALTLTWSLPTDEATSHIKNDVATNARTHVERNMPPHVAENAPAKRDPVPTITESTLENLLRRDELDEEDLKALTAYLASSHPESESRSLIARDGHSPVIVERGLLACILAILPLLPYGQLWTIYKLVKEAGVSNVVNGIRSYIVTGDSDALLAAIGWELYEILFGLAMDNLQAIVDVLAAC